VTDPIRELLDRLTHEIDNWECAIAGNQNAETRGYLTSRRDESFAERQAIIDLARERDTVMADAKSMARLLKREREDGNALSAALEAAHSERDEARGDVEMLRQSGYALESRVDELRAALARAEARVRDLERDKERLDWLAENAMKAVTPDDFVDSLIQFAYPGNDLREAIDAARAQRREEPSE